MQSLENNFLLSANKTCRGFDRYLAKSREGRWLVFNWEFFLFSPFWFAAHKMYFHAILYLTFILTLYFISGFAPFSHWTHFLEDSMALLLAIYSCIAYRLYHNHCQRILLKTKFNENLFMDKVKPLGSIWGTVSVVLTFYLSIYYIAFMGKAYYQLFTFFHIPLK